MEKRKKAGAVVAAAFIFLCCCLSGCSFSFCGLRLGAQDELTFSCDGTMQAETGGSGPLPGDNDADTASGPPPGAEEDVASGQPPAAKEADRSPGQPFATEPEGDADGRIDLNLAGIEELMTLDGIGESRARAVVEYREHNGAFTKAEDIMQVSGIKEGIFSKIKDKITVR